MDFPNKKYQIIYADPPWGYKNKAAESGSSRGFAENHYALMSLEDLKQLPIKDISENDSFCVMWVTFPMLKQGLELLEAWGFEYRSVLFTWHKITKNGGTFWGCGYYSRANNEIAILGKKGRGLKVLDHGVHQVIESQRAKHSQKPNEAADKIVKLFGDVPRIELFARDKKEGWDSWGNEAPEITEQGKGEIK